LLREAELWSATAAVHAGHAYPYEALDRLWKQVLLLQFHDILPGSSIGWVHREAEVDYAQVAAELEELIAGATAALVGSGSHPVVFNTSPRDRAEVVVVPAGPSAVTASVSGGQRLSDGGIAVFSHFVLDLLMHPGDLALWPHSAAHIGFGIWTFHPPFWWFFELAFIALCLTYYVARAKKLQTFGGRAWAVVAVVAILHVVNSPWLSPK